MLLAVRWLSLAGWARCVNGPRVIPFALVKHGNLARLQACDWLGRLERRNDETTMGRQLLPRSSDYDILDYIVLDYIVLCP